MTTDRLSQIFGALADPTRRAILARLADGEATVTELAEPFDISLPAISRHLKVLEKGGPPPARRVAPGAPQPPRGRAVARGDRLDGTLPPLLGRELHPA